MPALAYAALIRIVRSLEESELYPHEVEVLRNAADARLLADADRDERMAEAEELLGWLVESERLDSEVVLLVREQLHAIVAAAVAVAGQQVRRPAQKPRPRSKLARAWLALWGVPVEPPAPAPAPQPVDVTLSEELDPETLAALQALDELDAQIVAEATGVAPERDALDAAGRPFEADRMFEQAERLLEFHAWLEEHDRR